MTRKPLKPFGTVTAFTYDPDTPPSDTACCPVGYEPASDWKLYRWNENDGTACWKRNLMFTARTGRYP